MKGTLFFALATIVALSACVMDVAQLARHNVDFGRKVKPFLEFSCLKCHDGQHVAGGLNLETKAHAMKGGRSGPVIVPGSPDQSRLYKVLLLGHDSPVSLPPPSKNSDLDHDYEQSIHDWIQQGAKWPDGVSLALPKQ